MAPTRSAILVSQRFANNSIHDVLIPGIGYGRNAQPFIDEGMKLTGIEISATAIALAKKHFKDKLTLYHGSISQMPFNANAYDGIFCHAVVHLLDSDERLRFIKSCYNQLVNSGLMIFTAITKQAPQFKKGTRLSTDRYEMYKGAGIYYYDLDAVQREFESFGLIKIEEIQENQPMYLITCKKST